MNWKSTGINPHERVRTAFAIANADHFLPFPWFLGFLVSINSLHVLGAFTFYTEINVYVYFLIICYLKHPFVYSRRNWIDSLLLRRPRDFSLLSRRIKYSCKVWFGITEIHSMRMNRFALYDVKRWFTLKHWTVIRCSSLVDYIWSLSAILWFEIEECFLKASSIC